MKRINTKGFTIIELLIATVSFSVILLVLTAAIVQFNRLYYKGVVDTKTQETTRAIVDDITRNIQFASGPSSVKQGDIPSTLADDGYICTGDYMYTYRKREFVNSGGVLIKFKLADLDNGACNYPALPGKSGTELMGSNMYLQDIKLNKIGGSSSYTLTVRIGYGDLADHRPDGSCRYAIRLGGQFCAYHDLSVTVTQRF